MKLRDHPFMTRKSGVKNWPPVWTTTHAPDSTPAGEVGILKAALMHDLFDNKVFLFIEHRSLAYTGALQFDNPRFCYEIYSVLKQNIGRSIREIGDLDLSYTLVHEGLGRFAG